MKSDKQFVQELQRRAKEQAKIDASSPIPESLRPFAALVGEKSWQFLLVSSLVVAVMVSSFTFKYIYALYEKGVLYWLINR